jgi:hypothetical protein
MGDKYMWTSLCILVGFIVLSLSVVELWKPVKTPQQICANQHPIHLNDYCRSLIKNKE